MTMLLDKRSLASTQHIENNIAEQTVLPSGAQEQYRTLERQAARSRQAFERLDRSETKLKTSAIQMLLAILHYAASQDDPPD